MAGFAVCWAPQLTAHYKTNWHVPWHGCLQFLAPEKLRGVGGILLDAQGRRFVNELATRDMVAAAVMAQPGRQAFLLLGSESAQRFGPAIEFYASKGLFSKAANCEAAAKAMGVPSPVLEATLAQYSAAAVAGRDAHSGKDVFPAAIDPAGGMYVAQVTPVVHYCMGGVRVDEVGRVLQEGGQPVVGLFAAGEVASGVHGHNRLGGNSLLECVVFGRRAGRAAAEFVAPSDHDGHCDTGEVYSSSAGNSL